jgi:hypothetical protein
VHDAQGETVAALAEMKHSLEVAANFGFFRTFVDLGPALTSLLRRLAATQASSMPYLHHLLGALDGTPGAARVDKALFISPQTVKSHVANVYDKLGAGNRRQALVIAGSLGWNPQT